MTNRVGARFSLIWVALAAGACSAVDPHVGPNQTACGLSASGANSTSTGSSYYGANASGPAAACAVATDSACDACEMSHCCSTRTACYGDPTCACADSVLDQCLEAADASADSAATPACWSRFSATGAVEAARVACQRAWCAAECAVP